MSSSGEALQGRQQSFQAPPQGVLKSASSPKLPLVLDQNFKDAANSTRVHFGGEQDAQERLASSTSQAGGAHTEEQQAAIKNAVEQVLEHSKKNLDARDRIPYTFMSKPKSGNPSMHGGATKQQQREPYTWDNIAASAGLEDTSDLAEQERTELIRSVFTYELMSKCSNFRAHAALHNARAACTSCQHATACNQAHLVAKPARSCA